MAWAKNDWLSGDLLLHSHLNDLGNSIRTWGYGEPPRSVVINANKNHLAALGAVTFDTDGGFSDGTTAVPGIKFYSSSGIGLVCSGQLEMQAVCGSAVVATFSPAQLSVSGKLIARNADFITASEDGAMNFGEGYGAGQYASFIWDRASDTLRIYYAGVSPDVMQFGPSGSIKMRLGGTLKTLSVDGSGFAKAA